jgi:hypothetical protein
MENNETLMYKFTCPISKRVFEKPRLASDGFFYEEQEIKKWFTESNKSPITRNIFLNMNLFESVQFNTELKNYIEYCKLNNIQYDIYEEDKPIEQVIILNNDEDQNSDRAPFIENNQIISSTRNKFVITFQNILLCVYFINTLLNIFINIISFVYPLDSKNCDNGSSFEKTTVLTFAALNLFSFLIILLYLTLRLYCVCFNPKIITMGDFPDNNYCFRLIFLIIFTYFSLEITFSWILIKQSGFCSSEISNIVTIINTSLTVTSVVLSMFHLPYL